MVFQLVGVVLAMTKPNEHKFDTSFIMMAVKHSLERVIRVLLNLVIISEIGRRGRGA